MSTFRVEHRSAVSFSSPVERLWAALSDPSVVAACTPNVTRIDAGGDHWVWQMADIPVPGQRFDPRFGSVVEAEEPRRIRFAPDPARQGDQVRLDAGYALTPTAAGGTGLGIDLGVAVDLPIPRLMRGPVEGAMQTMAGGMARGFAQNLARHLGERP